MRNGAFFLLVLSLAVIMTACLSPENERQNVDGSRIEIRSDIVADVTWSKENEYLLQPKDDGSYVFVRPGVTLTIEAGTHIFGSPGAALIIARGAKIEALGTALAPIVFTSAQEVGSRKGGDWGGVLILGNAPTNWDGNNQLFEALPEGESMGRYGGDNADDSSGTLRYVRIEFAGFEYASDAEFNGLTLSGVGRGTLIDYVQVHRSSDDGIEIFGGTVNLRHILSSQNEDDGFDLDSGWQGMTQFLVVQHLNGRSKDPNGIESDNHKSDFDSLPRTHGQIANVTLVGDRNQSKPSFGALIRRGSGDELSHVMIQDFSTAAVEVRNNQSASLFGSTLEIINSVFYNNAASGQDFVATQPDFDELLFTQSTWNNRQANALLTDPFSLEHPNFIPAMASPLRTPTALPFDDAFFDSSAQFAGAVGDIDWTAGWAAYPQN